MILDIISIVLGVTAPAAAAAMLMAAIRRMLRHSISLWGVRSLRSSGLKYEYRFAIQNLEPVPVDDSLFVTITEEFAKTNDVDHIKPSAERIRVYSGLTVPDFLGTRSVDSTSPTQIVTALRFPRMPPHDTWTLKIQSCAKSIEIGLKPRDLNVGLLNPFKLWIAVTLSSDSLIVNGDAPVSRGAKALPTWTTALVVAMTGPLLYLGTFGFFWLLSQGNADSILIGSFSWLDGAAVALLALGGFGWYRWVRRPVYPTIQSYHTFWQPDCDYRRTEDDYAEAGQPKAAVPSAVELQQSN
jgi:hypothetical protein